MQLLKVTLLIVCTVFSWSAQAQDKKLEVGFVISRTVNDLFYGPVVDFMKMAASAINVNLHVVETNGDHLQTLPLIEVLHKKSKLDGLIVVSVKESGNQVLSFCESANLPLLIEDAAIVDPTVGDPRQKFKKYIGEIVPDDEMAGYELAKHLIKQGKPAKNGKIQVLAITGAYGTTASTLREKGLARAIKEAGNAELMQTVSGRWEMAVANQLFRDLKKRFPEGSVLWAASDGMAIGASQAASDMKLIPGQDMAIGGVDWSQEGVEALKAGKIQATAGGHFMEGAWALIVMADYLRGQDFAKSDGLKMKTDMALLTQSNLSKYQPLLDKKSWGKIKFQQFSKVYNKGIKRYDFRLEKVMKEVDLKR